MTMFAHTPEEREEQILYAIGKTFFLDKDMSRAVLDSHLANQMRTLDQEISRVTNPYRRRCRYMAWAEGLAAAQAVIFWRELRLRASSERAAKRRWRTEDRFGTRERRSTGTVELPRQSGPPMTADDNRPDTPPQG